MTEILETLEEISEKCDNLLCAASMPLPPHIHVEGLRGGMEEIKKMADEAIAAALRDRKG